MLYHKSFMIKYGEFREFKIIKFNFKIT